MPEQAPPTAVRWLEISPERAGQRLDNFLLTQLKGVPRSHIYRIVRTGQVRINKGRVRPAYKLQAGDQVRIPPVRMGEKPNAPAKIAHLPPLQTRILYEDNRLIVLNKTSGQAVHGGSGISLGVIEQLRAERPNAPFLELVHRLDRETSGCLLIAKRRSTLKQLHTLLREQGIDKRYRALLVGHCRPTRFKIEAPLLKHLQGGERMVHVNEEGKAATSYFHILAANHHASLAEIHPLTGRTHQIRVHAVHTGHAIVGDKKYGNRESNQEFKARGFQRLFLHAYRLRFTLPEGDLIRVCAPLDASLIELLNGLGLPYDATTPGSTTPELKTQGLVR